MHASKGWGEGDKKRKKEKENKTPHLSPLPRGERRRNSLSPWGRGS